MTEHGAVIIAAIVTTFGGIIVALLNVVLKKVGSVDDAVNHRHLTGGKRLADHVHETSEKVSVMSRHVDKLDKWRSNMESSPWGSAEGVNKWIDDHEKQHEEINKKLEQLSK